MRKKNVGQRHGYETGTRTNSKKKQNQYWEMEGLRSSRISTVQIKYSSQETETEKARKEGVI